MSLAPFFCVARDGRHSIGKEKGDQPWCVNTAVSHQPGSILRVSRGPSLRAEPGESTWQTEGYGVSFVLDNYERTAVFAKSAKGKVMISINDNPDIRHAFAGLHLRELSIRYSVANRRGASAES